MDQPVPSLDILPIDVIRANGFFNDMPKEDRTALACTSRRYRDALAYWRTNDPALTFVERLRTYPQAYRLALKVPAVLRLVFTDYPASPYKPGNRESQRYYEFMVFYHGASRARGPDGEWLGWVEYYYVNPRIYGLTDAPHFMSLLRNRLLRLMRTRPFQDSGDLDTKSFNDADLDYILRIAPAIAIDVVKFETMRLMDKDGNFQVTVNWQVANYCQVTGMQTAIQTLDATKWVSPSNHTAVFSKQLIVRDLEEFLAE